MSTEMEIDPSQNATHGIVEWVMWAATAIVGTLTGVISYLYKINITDTNKRTDSLIKEVDKLKEDMDKLEEARVVCEIDRARLSSKCEHLEKECTSLKGRLEKLESK